MTGTLRVLVTGSRTWANQNQIYLALTGVQRFAAGMQRELIITHGGCPTGADMFVDQWAKTRPGDEYNIQIHRVEAQWHLLGRGAGMARNKSMVALGHDLCLAFLSDPIKSPGTLNCMALATEAKIPVYAIAEER